MRRTDWLWMQAGSESHSHANELWSSFDALPEDVRGSIIGRFCLVDVMLAPLKAGEEGVEPARLSFRIEDRALPDRLDEMWLRALSAEEPDEQAYLMNRCQLLALSEEHEYWLDAPKATLELLVDRICHLEDGACLRIGVDDGVAPSRSDGKDQLRGGGDLPKHHRWLFARRGDVVMVDSTLLESEIYVSCKSLEGALAGLSSVGLSQA